MYYRNRDTGEVLFGGDVRKLHKKVSFRSDGGTFSDLGYDEIASTPPPAPSTNLKEVKTAAPVQDANGNWVESYEEVDMFSGPTKADDEAAHIARLVADKETGIRTDRDQRIALTDWTALSDVTMTADMATYRQALRDITIHSNFPDLKTEDWPTKPE